MLLPILAACHKDDPLVRHAPLGFVSTASGSTTSPGTTTSTPATFPTTPTHTVPDGDPWSAVPTPPMLSSSVLAAVADDIDAIVASTSATTGVYVQDYENGQVVYAYDEDGPKTPASNTKLFTTGVAFDELGQDHRFEVTAYGDALPDASGAVDTVTLVGEHDFTWSTFFYESSSFPAERLADRLWDAGVRAIGQVVVSGEYEVEGYELGYLDTAGSRSPT
jgi:D-alanyl-D-alanine carboxypeptidase